MLPRLSAFAVCIASFAAHAQPADPLKTAECGKAIERLELARAGQGAGVERLRHEAARACFGTGTAPARPARVARQPVVVPPPQIALPAAVPGPAQPAGLPAPVRIDRPASVSACDPGGCWADDGVRLHRVPPILMAPGGLCATAPPGAPGCP
jgi:hypothetical protein